MKIVRSVSELDGGEDSSTDFEELGLSTGYEGVSCGEAIGMTLRVTSAIAAALQSN